MMAAIVPIYEEGKAYRTATTAILSRREGFMNVKVLRTLTQLEENHGNCEFASTAIYKKGEHIEQQNTTQHSTEL